MKKITVIIPNYNNEKYILQCLNSVAKQGYKEKEIIVIDDGSTDNSVSMIKKFMRRNQQVKIELICQNNLNAAMARNKGMEVATGDYALFLDSDDVLEEDILTKLMIAYKKNDVDLIFGNYEKIDEDSQTIQERAFTAKDTIWDARDKFAELVSFDPVPTNKLYNLKLIRKNKLEWGNVRIGQDLNFYLKYLLLCKKVMLSNEKVYKYRISTNSMSRKYDLRIFDIINAFNDVENFYIKNKQERLYKQYLMTLAFRHMSMQMNKQIYYKDMKLRRLIVKFFSVNERALDYKISKNCDQKFKKEYRNFKLKTIFCPIFTSNLYCRYILGRRGK